MKYLTRKEVQEKIQRQKHDTFFRQLHRHKPVYAKVPRRNRKASGRKWIMICECGEIRFAFTEADAAQRHKDHMQSQWRAWEREGMIPAGWGKK